MKRDSLFSIRTVVGFFAVGIFATLSVSVVAICVSDEGGRNDVPEPIEPVLAAASGEGLTAIGTFKFPGLECELWAAEPDVGNIVALHRD